MKLFIDGSGGFAGDMFCAALISAGASEENVIGAMENAASRIGTSDIICRELEDALQLEIKFESKHHHLKGLLALELLNDIFNELNISEKYRTLGFKMLDILLDAETEVHNKNKFFSDIHNQTEPHLHEAQDILIDITGAVKGMEELELECDAFVSVPVSLGGGKIKFSHGTLPVPAPATEFIINKYSIPVKKGPLEIELFTPTGAAVLAALNVSVSEPDNKNIFSEGCSRGSKILKIPPLKLMVVK